MFFFDAETKEDVTHVTHVDEIPPGVDLWVSLCRADVGLAKLILS